MQVGDRPARDGRRVGHELERLDRDIPVVSDFLKRFQDGAEFHLAEARPLHIGIVRVYVGEHLRLSPDDVGNRLVFTGHRLHVQYQTEVRVRYRLHHPASLGGGIDEAGFVGAERLDAERDAAVGQHGEHTPEGRQRPLPRIFLADPLNRAALSGGAEHHDLAAQVGAEVGEVAEVVSRSPPDPGIRVTDMQPLRLDQEPVQPDDLQTCLPCRRADIGAGAGGEFLHVVRERERRDLDAVISGLGERAADGRPRCVLESFVAEGKAHFHHPFQRAGLRQAERRLLPGGARVVSLPLCG